ncbi:preprotein translocase subunit SecG [Mycoplasma sp. CSL10137]|uniref:preprotein translocase subunit SecG n=1 Tax=unclassified Mycoplasma TaxID=2683645 RepID=UPI00197B3655|nr:MULTISPECIES: preprotein translocase subunit SecG [unclassified Mycoplasma]MBN4083244.1 preprotein translocase subunit SecG [Mycoplasma sp. CSL10137]MBN4084459.1 preprotein translocase subunit SecG [Mycoplasma sp. CSL10166]MBU4692939.1 preprotein translocase subunit SecG [Mycoplasma sp. CSL7491-lung]MCU4706572.1 preprotein translocase subunit SecG [Mycoplasma sp. CSL7503-lung]
MTILTVVLILCSFIIILISFAMSPDSNGFSGALVGSGDLELFKNSKERGIKKVLKYSMMFFGFVLFASAIILKAILS